MTYDRITGNSNNQSDKVDDNTLKKALVETANSYDGITGRTVLNDAGDRIAGSYDLWTIIREGSGEDNRNHANNNASSPFERKKTITFHNTR